MFREMAKLKDEGLKLDQLQDPGDRYQLQEVIGSGVFADVHAALDTQSGNKRVAIKIQAISPETMPDIEEEYRILRDLSEHPNLPDFYGAYLKKDGDKDKIWFVLQLCEGGPVTDVVRAVMKQNKKMTEIHIAFILKEALKALVFLHANHVIHRDVKASNILLTNSGEVKLVDFGLSRELGSTLGRCNTVYGSPCWMAPEVISTETQYDNRADVWALGITAIELADGRTPFDDIHPTRILFQIVRNPPPTLYRPASWSQTLNDFISECLVKNIEYRPYMAELLDHPFLTELPENDFHLNNELKILLETISPDVKEGRRKEVKIKKGLLQKNQDTKPEQMQVEDLAALDSLTDEAILQELEVRFKKNQFYTFVGDILLFLNPNKNLDLFGFQYHSKYKLKSRSDNEPHIFGVADSAYQDMLHHEQTQSIILSGETMSGKTTQFKLLLKHLVHLGMGNKSGDKVQKGLELIHAFGNAATPVNGNSTRHLLLTQLTFSKSGKTSGAIFWLYQLEKWRVTGNRCPQHANFHIFYYFYDGLAADGTLEKYKLQAGQNYRYLRREIDEADKDPKAPLGPREEAGANVDKFHRIKNILEEFEFETDQFETIWKTLAAILLLGEVEFESQSDGHADLKDTEVVDKIAELLSVDSKKLAWALCNYCIIENDTAERRRHSRPEAIEAKNVLARAIYTRLVDWLVNIINMKLSLSRAVFGDTNCINLLDLFGFECYPNNGLEQLFANIFNEQLQYYYSQKNFISEWDDIQEEEIELPKLQFYDNKSTMDELMNKPKGILYLLDEANKLDRDADFITESLKDKGESSHVRPVSEIEFSVAHYTGKVTYDASLMCHKNRDFLPPELTDVMRASSDPIIKASFTNKLSRTGNVTLMVDDRPKTPRENKKRWGAALMLENTKTRRFNTMSRGEFSQTKGIRTAAAVFRATSLELLRHITSGGAHFIRCLRTDLNSTPDGFQPMVVRQQLKALAIIDTARSRQHGYSCRIHYTEFLKRYKFLAFDFDENVDETVDNCRLLLVRLKLEGYVLGKSKIFLKYYNEEYLSRLYETQVKKVVKVQSMLRAFLAKRNIANKQKKQNIAKRPNRLPSQLSEDNAAIIIQKHIKGYCARKRYGPLINIDSGKIDSETAGFIRPFAIRWKLKSMFQVLLHYRAVRLQDLAYFSQQVHLYSQNVASCLRQNNNEDVDLKKLKQNVDPTVFIGKMKPAVWKVPFRMKEQPFYDSSRLCGTFRKNYEREYMDEDTYWDDPFSTLDKGCQAFDDGGSYKEVRRDASSFIETPYCRDPEKAEVIYKKQRAMEAPSPYKVAPAKVVRRNQQPRKGLAPETNRQNYDRRIENQRPKSPKNLDVRREVVNANRPEEPEKPLINFRQNLKTTGSNVNQVNPVKELEMKGRQNSNTQSEDDPPFNFQAMLRKTNYKRESIRRENGEEEESNNNANVKTPGKYVHKKGKAPTVNVNNKPSILRQNSFEAIKLMVSTSKDFKQDLTGTPENSEALNNNFRSVNEELVPGLKVVGQVADL